MKANFVKALFFTLKWEGYKSDNPKDPGGRTIFGISEKYHPKEVAEMWDMPKAKAAVVAAKVYKREYWHRMGCDNMAFPLDIILFDTAVNCGVGRASLWLGKARSGNDYLFIRLKHYTKLNRPIFLRGWINRVIALHEYINKLKEGGEASVRQAVA